MPPRPFLAPAEAGVGEDAARSVAEAVVATLKGEPEGAVILAGTSTNGQNS